MSQAVIATIGVFFFLLLSGNCLRFHGSAIEARLAADAQRGLTDAGVGWAEVAIDGRDATLRGFAPDAASRGRAHQALSGVAGVRRVSNEIQLRDEVFSPARAAESFETRLKVSAGFVRFTGFMPGREQRERLLNETRALFPGRQVEDETFVLADAPPGWKEAMLVLLQRFATYVSGDAVIDGNRVDVVAEVPPGRDDESRILANRLPSSFVTGITINVARGNAVGNCQRRLDELMRTRVSFRLASDVIEPASYASLDRLAQAIRECGTVRIEVAGHTDSEGLATRNLELSQRRAQAVVAYLVDRGITAGQLVPWGYGESRPIADNTTAAGRAANRRIEFRAIN